jgi:catechol O-methyltransferase
LKDEIQKRGPYDAILIDHIKNLYLSDFKLLEEYGIIKKGTILIGDNIIYPGSPDYLAFFKESKDYDSTLYHSYLEYCNKPDAVLISIKL